jgi:integrase
LERVRQGIDPAEEKRARRETRHPEADTFGAVARDYLERHLRKNRRASTYAEAKPDLEHDAIPKWGNRLIASIGRRDVIDLIDGILARGATVRANRTLTRLRAFFNWAIEKGRLTASPIARMKLPTQERARDRVLIDDELRWLWRACEAVGWPFGPLCKLLLLTGQRRDEVATMTWPDIDIEGRLWTIPRHKVKNDRAHAVQLSNAALAVLRSLPRVGNGLIFTTTIETPVSGFSRAKRRLDAAMLEAKCSAPARLGFPPHVVEKVLNHASGTIRGVAAVYNRFAYLEERRAALETWGRHVTGLVVPARQTNVVALREVS